MQLKGMHYGATSEHASVTFGQFPFDHVAVVEHGHAAGYVGGWGTDDFPRTAHSLRCRLDAAAGLGTDCPLLAHVCGVDRRRGQRLPMAFDHLAAGGDRRLARFGGRLGSAGSRDAGEPSRLACRNSLFHRNVGMLPTPPGVTIHSQLDALLNKILELARESLVG